MKMVVDIPFTAIPRGLIDQIYNRKYDYEHYLQCCDFYDASPTYWNFVLMNDKEEIVGVVWGTYEPLDRFIHVVRVSIKKEHRPFVKEYVATGIKEIAAHFGATSAFFITDKKDADKYSASFYLSKSLVSEVLLDENLH